MAETKSREAHGVSGVSGRYGLALFELARDEGKLDEVSGSLDRFEGLLNDSPDLQRLLKSPVFSADEQLAAIGAVLDRAGIGGLASNLIRFVAQQRRLFALPGMISSFRALLARSKGIIPAEVRLAEEPSSKVMEEIRSSLREMTGSDVDLAVRIDPSLIGGMVVKIGSRMVDASLRTKLNSIRQAMYNPTTTSPTMNNPTMREAL